MADSVLGPVAAVQNPAFGATLLWRFGAGYQEELPDSLPLLPLFFIVLPLALHAPTVKAIAGTQFGSGLSRLATKLAERKEDLLAIHERALKLRALTLLSLSTGIAARLLSIDYGSATVRANEASFPRPPERLKSSGAAAEKFGRWAARLPPGQVLALLQVHA